MTIKKTTTIDMVAYLSMQGYEPVKINGNNYWYYSPFRTENTPSFKVNQQRNQWYDFGIGKGGNLLDFVQHRKGCTIQEALSLLNETAITSVPIIPITHNTPSIEIISTHIVSAFHLVRYYRSRRIANSIANEYLQEIRYKNGDKTYYALGFQNDAGGYELRSPYFKGSSHPKASTWIKNNATHLAVFEGFFDLLTSHTIHQHQPTPLRDFLVLNSTSFFDRQLPIMQAYDCVHLYLDNDPTGNKYTARALAVSPEQFIDERRLYEGYKDINDWHQHMGKAPKPAA